MIRTSVTTAAVAAALLTATPAVAADTSAARSRLTLGYQAQAGYAAAVVLECSPAGGAHPEPVKACNALKKVAGKPAKLKPAAGRMCTLQYDPVTVEITGRWKGKKITWTETYGNSCEMSRATGVLFAF